MDILNCNSTAKLSNFTKKYPQKMPINHLSTIDYSLKVSNYVINSIDFRKVSTNSKKLPMSTLKKWSRTYTPQ